MSSKRHPPHEEHENHERWLVSYADFMTLLFAFFVVMYSVSRVDTKRAQQAEKSIQWAMHFSGTGGNGQMPIFEGPATAQTVISMGGSPLTPQQVKVLDTLKRRFSGNGNGGTGMARRNVRVQVEGTRLTLRLTAAHLFGPGLAAIEPDALATLDSVADEVLALGRPIRIEGHTDDQSVSSARFRNNWELSAARAAAVVTYLVDAHHVRPELLSATGYGSTRPVGPNTTEEERESNRRIDVTIELAPGDPLSLATMK